MEAGLGRPCSFVDGGEKWGKMTQVCRPRAWEEIRSMYECLVGNWLSISHNWRSESQKVAAQRRELHPLVLQWST